MTTTEFRPLAAPIEPAATPPLENGDRLTRAEFERRYHTMPHVKKAELIDGRVYMPSPVSHRKHSRPHAMIGTWLGHYWAATPGVEAGDNGSIRMDDETMPQPDAYLLIYPECGGQCHISDDDYLEGAPELVVEVASSTVSYDLHEKRNSYQRNGVREYVVVRIRDEAVDWLALRAGKYEPLQPDASGVYRSEVFPGLWLDSKALLAGKLAEVLRVQGLGNDSPEHAEFVQRMQRGGMDAE